MFLRLFYFNWFFQNDFDIFNINFRKNNFLKDSLLLNCYFFKILSNDLGGALYFNYNFDISISSTLFFECFTTSTSGGGYYIISNNFFLEKTCGFNCSHNSNSVEGSSFGFSYIQNKNIIFFSSISNMKTKNDFRNSILLKSGYQNISNFNSSNNYLYQNPLLFPKSPLSHHIKFCSFQNNFCIDSIGIWIYGGSQNFYNLSNIINNSSPTQGLLCNESPFSIITECIFLNNKGPILGVFNGYMKVNFCFIDYLTITYNSPDLISNYNYSFTYKIDHLFTYYCLNNYKNYSKKLNKFNQFLILFLINFILN